MDGGGWEGLNHTSMGEDELCVWWDTK